jgi:hypothetical protein
VILAFFYTYLYGGRRHTQLAIIDDIPAQSRIHSENRRTGSSKAGPSRKRDRDGQGDGGLSAKRGRLEVVEERDETADAGQMGRKRRDLTPESTQGNGDGVGAGKGKGKSKRARGKEKDTDQDGDGLEGSTKRQRTRGSQLSLPDVPIDS